MKIYIAARAKTRLEEVKRIQKKLHAMGHTTISDWAETDIKRPYRDPGNRRHNKIAQEKMLRTAAKADVLILLDEPGLRGAYVELGAFLTDCLDNPAGRKAYIVGPDSHEREFVFESPDYVIIKDTIEEVYEDLSG